MKAAATPNNRSLSALFRFGAVAALSGLCAWYEVAAAAARLTLE
jgi:hypothetical protein